MRHFPKALKTPQNPIKYSFFTFLGAKNLVKTLVKRRNEQWCEKLVNIW